MSRPNGLSTRRQFLERSALGFGSAFLLPSLLQSCTDHRIPPDDGTDWPYTDWPYTGPLGSIDWNNTAKSLVITGLGLIPEVGGILGGLTGIFWPDTKEDVWGEVKNYVEQVIDLKIDALVYQTVSDDLKGLSNSLTLYLGEVKNGGNSASVLNQWQITKNLFVNALPHFQSQGYELPLLCLFAQFANMYLAVLRDGVLKGKDWGRTDADQVQDKKDLQTAISDFTTYATNWYKLGRVVKMLTPADYPNCEPFRTVNAYDRQLTQTVLDYRDTWKYYDVTLYSKGAKNPDGTPIKILTREIYTDPMGTCKNSLNPDPIGIPIPVPTQFPSRIAVWGDERINSVEVWYGSGSTGKMGVRIQDADPEPPYGGDFMLTPDNPITEVQVRAGDYIETFQFKFHDGSVTDVFGGRNNPNRQTPGQYWSFPLEALSSIYVHGVSRFFYNNSHFLVGADCIVFGFQYWQPPTATLNAIRLLYVRSLKEYSVADFAKAFPNLAIPANLITDAVRAARRKHWAYIEARAKELK